MDFVTILKLQEEQRKKHCIELTEKIRVLPTDENLLMAVARLGPTDQQTVLRSHPGYLIARKLDSLWSMLAIFRKAHFDLLIQLDQFDAFSLTEEMHLPAGRPQLRMIEIAVHKELMAFSAAAIGLVYFCRRIMSSIDIPGFKEHRESIFDAEEHAFITALRNIICHEEFPEVGWQITHASKRESDFVLSPQELLQMNCTKEARTFVERHSKGIHIRALVNSYSAKVSKFYDWYKSALEAATPTSLVDFWRIMKYCKAQNSRSIHRMILSQLLQKNADPYTYLNRVLLPSEIEEASKFPKHSQEQVDFIIRAADKYDACNAELRQMIYKLFKVEPA